MRARGPSGAIAIWVALHLHAHLQGVVLCHMALGALPGALVGWLAAPVLHAPSPDPPPLPFPPLG